MHSRMENLGISKPSYTNPATEFSALSDLEDRVRTTALTAANRLRIPAAAFLPLRLLYDVEKDGRIVKRSLRHDLEPLIWVTLWICEGSGSRKRLSWTNPSHENAPSSKFIYWHMHLKRVNIPDTIKDTDRCLWGPLCSVIGHWMMSMAEESFQRVTFPDVDFVKCFGEGFAHEVMHRDWHWADFSVPVNV